MITCPVWTIEIGGIKMKNANEMTNNELVGVLHEMALSYFDAEGQTQSLSTYEAIIEEVESRLQQQLTCPKGMINCGL